MVDAIIGDTSRLLPTVVVSLLAYLAVVTLLRISGKRTLSSWNSFDFVVTVAFGSTLATVVLDPETSALQGAVAFAVLILLQFIVTWLSVRSPTALRIIKAKPTLLMDRGELRPDALKRSRVNEAEVRASLRAHGVGRLDAEVSVVLETDGAFSVIPHTEVGRGSTLIGVEGYDAPSEIAAQAGEPPENG